MKFNEDVNFGHVTFSEDGFWNVNYTPVTREKR